MARQAGNENLSSLSCRRVFELFARLSEPLPDSTSRAMLHDALFFDYCQSEMPLMGKLPCFAAEHQNNCSWPSLKELPGDLNLPANCRVKAFRYEFMKDYRLDVPPESRTTVTFVYVSGSGVGLRILTT
jgi:hypothetical protein